MNPEVGQKKSGWNVIREWIQTILIALLIAVPIRFFIAEPFIVSGASMDPTFASGQFLIVDRLSYRIDEPKRDDVVIFRYPNNPSVYYIKRIIGLPGETLEISNGKITITNSDNPAGFSIEEPYVALGNMSHETLQTKLEASHYFVMGDNRLQSSDSRVWGPLDQKYIVGRPILRLLPISKLSLWPGEIK